MLVWLTTLNDVGMIANMETALLYRHKLTFDDGAILEIVVWRLSKPVEGCTHSYKYRLFYGYPGQRVIGYDNEKPKGDHCHKGSVESDYVFESPEKLIADFLSEVEKRGAEL